MTFQEFIFNTYPGYLIQALPLSLISGAIYGIVKYRHDSTTALYRKIGGVLFVMYITALVEMVLALGIIRNIWYLILYHRWEGIGISFLNFNYNFIPDFFMNFDRENLGNIIAFIPFGLLYPLANKKATWISTFGTGTLTSVLIEVIQPFLGRSFDVNDIILNAFGVFISCSVFYIIKLRLCKKQ